MTVERSSLVWLLQKHGVLLDRETLERIVKTNEKQRFSFSEDGQKIRANQGHSVH
ncbi:RNA 2'-phosphotransferase [Thermoactinomyces daqus]|uniref:RNA 2'-phosphotransferase n=1 Tax=Thermoactinomyces daqus TaxID=1329516 RepID=A0A7W1XD83_9BACL|nr:RNA 2'-phosphotransferase [Thermoactinomyces daqus]MBH8599660.1 RNA 2'-phosphotransferase [Thermoactinomyces sp. CICC 10523]MBH8605684.1 RNA 2'-phosphotransferase [Thermoactinomyces sp. CICC 10522]